MTTKKSQKFTKRPKSQPHQRRGQPILKLNKKRDQGMD